MLSVIGFALCAAAGTLLQNQKTTELYKQLTDVSAD